MCAAPHLRTFARHPTHEPYPHLRTFFTDPRTIALLSAEEAERLYDGNRAVLPYNQIVAPMLSERFYGGVWEKSIEYPRKVYRVFSESL